MIRKSLLWSHASRVTCEASERFSRHTSASSTRTTHIHASTPGPEATEILLILDSDWTLNSNCVLYCFIWRWSQGKNSECESEKRIQTFLNCYPECISRRLLVGCVLTRILPNDLAMKMFSAQNSKHFQHQSWCDPHSLDSSSWRWLTEWFGHVTQAFSSIRIHNDTTIRPENWRVIIVISELDGASDVAGDSVKELREARDWSSASVIDPNADLFD